MSGFGEEVVGVAGVEGVAGDQMAGFGAQPRPVIWVQKRSIGYDVIPAATEPR
jgi:hypothetical protein